MDVLKRWAALMGHPAQGLSEAVPQLVGVRECDAYSVETYLRRNAEGHGERILLTIPKNCSNAPVAVIPFYFPEAMLGFDPKSGKPVEGYGNVHMMHQLALRGFITVSAEAYHLTYLDSSKEIRDFSRWQDAADALLRDHPTWSGIGRLVYDTRRLIDFVADDPRADVSRIVIAGHSLGGKMAFYTGCLDPRVRAILASDFGFLWEQSNWHEDWYWGRKLSAVKESGLDHASLLSASLTPLCLLAGEYDDERSLAAIRSAKGFSEDDPRLCLIHHATGHRPPPDALQAGYDFLMRTV